MDRSATPSHSESGYMLLILALLSVLLCSGLLFGWAPLQLLFLEEGQYSELCDQQMKSGISVVFNLRTKVELDTAPMAIRDMVHTSSICANQLSRLNLIYSLGAFMLSAVSLPSGIFLDKFGPVYTLTLSACFEVSGLVLLSIADSRHLDTFIVAILSISIGGLLVMLSAFPVSFLFPEYQAVILASISCLFDASSIVFAMLYLLKDYGRTRVLLLYTMLCLVVYVATILLWKQHWRALSPSGSPNEDVEDGTIRRSKSIWRFDLREDMQLPVKARSIWGQLLSFEFFVVITFASVQMLRCYMYIGLNDELLAYYGDADHGFFYAKLFGYALPSGIMFVPLIDYTIAHLGLINALHVTNLLGFAYGILSLIPSLKLQVLVFFLFTCFRAFLYSVMSTYTAWIFGFDTFGRMTGFIFSISAVFTLLQYPLVTWINGPFLGNPLWVGALLTSACIPLFVLLFYSQGWTFVQPKVGRYSTDLRMEPEPEESTPLIHNK